MVDRLIRATAANNGIRAVGVITTHLTEEARQRHGLSSVAATVLGRAMAAGLLLASGMKQPQARVNLRFKGDGPLKGVMVDAGTDGTVRGYAYNPTVELLPNAEGKLEVGSAIGKNGFLSIIRDVGHGYPYSSTVELISGEIGEDVTHYLAVSEQTPSALSVGVFSDSQGVSAAGGLLVQVLPKAARDEALISLLESRLASLAGFTSLLKAGQTLPEIFEDLLGDLGLNIVPQSQMVRFNCACSSDRVLGALKILGTDELKDMIEKDKGAEVTCEFCNEVYQIPSQGLEQLIEDLMVEQSSSI